MSDLIIIPFIVFVLWGSRKSSEKEIFGIENTNSLKGVFAFVVLFGHAYELNQNSYLFCRFNNLGAYACAIFFFISGYGLMYQYIHKENYLKNFLSKRFVNVLIPAITGSCVYIVFKLLFIENYTISTIVNSSLEGHTPIIDNSWFIIELIVLYFIFYVVFIFNDSFKTPIKNDIFVLIVTALVVLLVIVIKFIGWGYNWYASVLSFPFGLFIANHSEVTKKLIKRFKILIIVFSIGFIVFATYYQLVVEKLLSITIQNNFLDMVIDILSKLIFVLLIFTFSAVFKVENPLIRFTSKISYELYIIHGLFVTFFNKIIIVENDFIKISSILICSIIFAFLMNYIDCIIVKFSINKS